MSTFTSRKLSRTAFAALIVAGGSSAFFAASVEPAMALCKYGTPHCINKFPGPQLPSVGGAKIPDSGWVDPDCKYYGNCNSSEVKGVAKKTPTGQPKLPVVAPLKTQTTGSPARLQSMATMKMPSMGGVRMGRGR